MAFVRWLITLLVSVGAVVGVAVFAVERVSEYLTPKPPEITITNEGVPEARQVPGGLLEVSQLNVPGERFVLRDDGKLGPLDFGTNMASLRADVVYRYRISLRSKWTMVRRGDKVTVVAPAVELAIPVGIDSRTLQRETSAGWLRFDKETTAEAALRQMSGVFEKRGTSASYIAQQRAVARRTVSEFVSKWGVYPMNSVKPENIKVLFADEPSSSLLESIGGSTAM